MYDQRLCKNFRDCLKVGNTSITPGRNGIIIDWSSVQEPDKFRDICASRALTVSGEEKSVSDILLETGKDMSFYKQSGGGVTLSGGEPLSQGSELDVLLFELKQRQIDVAIETSLHVTWEQIERCIDLTDTFLVDLKHTDTEKFNRFTGGDVSLVLKNLVRLAKCHNNVIIRIPVIPDFNHTEQEMNKIIDFSASLKTVNEIHFLPFHNLGSEKYKMLGMEYNFSATKKVGIEEMESYKNYAESCGLITKIGG
jgi:pyruvate formate lyase activating enzyme